MVFQKEKIFFKRKGNLLPKKKRKVFFQSIKKSKEPKIVSVPHLSTSGGNQSQKELAAFAS